MLRNLVIFSLCFVAIRACGEFSVLSSPKSLSFKGSDALQSEHVGDVLLAATGNPVAESVQWDALTLDDPFHLATGGVAMYCDGINHLSLSSSAKTFPLKGNNADESLKAVAAELKSANTAVCDIDFTQFSDALAQYTACFGDVAVPTVQGTKNLNPATSTADKEFLQAIALVNHAAENWAAIKKNNQFVIFRISLESLVKEHGEKSTAVAEASKLVSSAVANFNEEFSKSNKNNELFVVVANKDSGSRTKRQATPRASDDTTYNLAEYYNDDYPVIFNIILWFMVTFGLALLAICYAIGAMDPGRDSIIYRMTSTRMKKDN